ncbi:MAG: hypothetical protein NT056_07690 [Proteobacteria bacterium]|nr:hypothetical protein [Pseudomonadota bacterium]
MKKKPPPFPRPEAMGKFMLSLGRFYERLYRVPGIGESLVRGWCRNLGRVSFYSPSGLKRSDDLQGVKETLVESCRKMGFKMELSGEKPGQFEFFILECPYGYHRPDQQGVCDAAMDMDRVMFRLCGGDLQVEETIPGGAAKCRVTMRKN